MKNDDRLGCLRMGTRIGRVVGQEASKKSGKRDGGESGGYDVVSGNPCSRFWRRETVRLLEERR